MLPQTSSSMGLLKTGDRLYRLETAAQARIALLLCRWIGSITMRVYHCVFVLRDDGNHRLVSKYRSTETTTFLRTTDFLYASQALQVVMNHFWARQVG